VKKIFSILFALVLVVSLGLAIGTSVAADPGTTYYVSNTGSDDTGDGSDSNPWNTIQHAVGQVASGDTIMVATGEYDAFLVINQTNISIIGAEGATVTTANLVSVDVAPIEDAWVMAGVRFSENIDIEGIDFDGTDIIDEEVVVGIVYVDSTGRIADLAVENIFGADLAAGIVIIGDTGTSVVDLSAAIVENSMAGIAVWNAEVDVNACTVTGTDAGIVIAWPLAGFAPSAVSIHGSTIVGNNQAGIWVCDDSIVDAHFNNIVGNTDYGVRNDGGEMVNAIYNWWGDASGPYHESLNPDGKGDEVSDNVVFKPWLGSEPITQTVKNDTLNAIEVADIQVVVNGTATVTVAQYEENPGGSAPTGFSSVDKYIDVCVPDTTEVTELEIRLYYTDTELDAADVDEESLRLFWWNDTAWVQCSDSGVNTASTNGYSGYMWAKIRATGTTPSLDDLQGDEFGGYGHPSETPGGGCFIATAAYGTDTAGELDILREFRDEVLLPNSLGAKFVSLYYKTSPPMADFISQHEVLRTAVRVTFVDPIVAILTWSHNLWSA